TWYTIPRTRRCHGAWNTGSSRSTTTGPKPCIPPRSWIPSTGSPCARPILRELEPGNHPAVHLVGAVGDAERPRQRQEARQLGIRDTLAAVDLDRGVDDRLEHVRRHDLDRRDVGERGEDALAVELPRGLERQQPRLLDRHARVGDDVTVAAEVRETL